MRREGRGEGEGRGGEAFLVMWPRRLSALNPPLVTAPRRNAADVFQKCFAIHPGEGMHVSAATAIN